MKTNSKLSAYIVRGSTTALLFSCVIVALCSAINLREQPPKARPPLGNTVFGANGHESGTLSFADRVAYQRAIEDVYWRHRIWPKERPDPKPALDAVMSQAQLERKVEDYLRNSQALEDYWQMPITADQLQTEMERMASQTKQPEVLRELFAALGNDPFVIAECLARSILAERLIGALTEGVEHGEIDGSKSDAKTPRTPKDFVQRPEDLTLFREAFGMRQRPRVALALYLSVTQISMNARDEAGARNLDNGAYKLPEISVANDCIDAWTATSTTNAPTGRLFHTAVWTGSEMIIWGGQNSAGALSTGGRYNPSTDSWTATSITNAPTARSAHTAVWTGSEIIVWGGGLLNTGGRYNPSSDSWTATSTINAPSARFDHTAVWTGSEMIVWGGAGSGTDFNTGGRYDPSTDSWTATTITDAPESRDLHRAVWTGSEMVVWGGRDVGIPLNSGGRYSPNLDSWTATSTTNAPSSRYVHTAVVADGEVIVWGGFDGNNNVNTGGRYNLGANSWTATSTTNAPAARIWHTAVSTGNEMIIWGGAADGANNFNTGGRYSPGANSWTATSTNNAPEARNLHTAVWTGSEMIVWGGFNFPNYLNTGGKYCPLGSQLGNVSTRAFVQTGDNVVIGGFIVQGNQTKRVMIRAIGPELGAPPYNVPNALADPTLELHDGTGALIASNDNWQHTIIGGIITSDQSGDIQNSGHAPTDGQESAIIAELPAGNYTAIVRGVDNTMGVALVEVYDLNPNSNSILGNISTRAFVQTDDNVMIGGFIVQGNPPKRVIIRAIGPELGAPPYNVPNALVDPTLELHDGTGALIASNDNWQHTIIGGIITSDQSGDIQNSGHAPSDGRESAIIAELPAGNYTAIARGVNNTTGVGLVEVYDLDE